MNLDVLILDDNEIVGKSIMNRIFRNNGII